MPITQNILSSYPSYTYNLTLRLYGDSVMQVDPPVVPNPNGTSNVIIAQTGTTAQYFIQSVEIDANAGISQESIAALPSTLNITLVEPLGFSFVDRLLVASQNLGIKTLAEAAYTLEINFVGWDANGAPVSPIGTTKVYLCRLVNVNTDMSRKGAIYTLDLVPNHQWTLQESRIKIPKLLVFDKAASLQGTLANFGNALSNAFAFNSENQTTTAIGPNGDPTGLKYTYQFVLQNGDSAASNFMSWTMQQNTGQDKYGLAQMTKSDGKQAFQVTQKEGTDIRKIILGILGNTNEIDTYVNPPGTTDQIGWAGDYTGYFTIETNVSHTTYDPTTNAWSELHTITIIPNVILSSMIFTTNPGGASQVQDAINKNLIVKAYQWMFTGQNTEVIDLQMDMNLFWQDIIPWFNSSLTDRMLTNQPSPSTVPLEAVPPAVFVPDKASIIQSSSQSTPFALGATNADSLSSGTYLEDFSPQASTIQKFATASPNRPQTTAQDYMQGFAPAGGQVNNAKSSIFSFMSDVSLRKGTSAGGEEIGYSSIATVTLTIRGDPYWFLLSPEEADGGNYVALRNSQVGTERAVIQSGQQNVYLCFKPPQGLDDTTGLMNVNNNSVFNSIYFVQSIKSTFENGFFKQVLTLKYNTSFRSDQVDAALNSQASNPPISAAITSVISATPGAINAFASQEAADSASNNFDIIGPNGAPIGTGGINLLSDNNVDISGGAVTPFTIGD